MTRETAYTLTLDVGASASSDRRLDRSGRITFGKRGGLIGREGHLRIDLDFVSRCHAEVTCLGHRFFIEDCESQDGTYLNDQKLQSGRKYELLENDVVSVGDQLIGIALPPGNKYLIDDEEEIVDEIEDEPDVEEPPADDTQDPTAEKSDADTQDKERTASPPQPAPPDPGDATRESPRPRVIVHDGDALIAALLAGLRMNAEAVNIPTEDQKAFLEEMGEALFHAVDGVKKALIAHDSFRDQYSIPGTEMHRSQLNPLYGREIETSKAIELLLTSRSEAVAGLVEAVREATSDFYRHGIAVPVAIEAAIETIVQTFDWRRIEAELDSNPALAAIGPIRKSRLWELYCKEFDRRAKTLTEFDNSFRRAVARAYADERSRRRVRSREEDSDAE